MLLSYYIAGVEGAIVRTTYNVSNVSAESAVIGISMSAHHCGAAVVPIFVGSLFQYPYHMAGKRDATTLGGLKRPLCDICSVRH